MTDLNILRERIASEIAADPEHRWNTYSTSKVYTTSDEVGFVRRMAHEGKFQILASMAKHVDSRRYDDSVNRVAVKLALEFALSGVKNA